MRTPTPVSRLESIDTLRGLAALGVFVFHVSVFAGFPKRTLPPFELFARTFASIPNFLSVGASGVSLFFVLSGFCLALQRVKGRGLAFDPGSLRDYFHNRVARIVPAYWLTVALAVPLAVSGSATAPLAIDLLSHLLFLHGLHPSTFISLHGGLWSMATEVEFYVAFPVLVAMWARFGLGALLATSLAFTLLFRIVLASVPALDAVGEVSWKAALSYQLPGRLAEFVLGMALARAYLTGALRRPTHYWASAAMLLGPVLWVRGWGPYWLPDFAFGIFYAVILAAVLATPQFTLTRVSSIAAEFGRSSYSFFLLHYLVLAALARITPVSPSRPYTTALFLFGAGLPLSVAVGYAMYRGVELPLWRRWMARAQPRPVPSGAA